MKKNQKKHILLILTLFVSFIGGVFAETSIISDDQLSTITVTVDHAISEGEDNTAYRKIANGVYNAYCISGYTVAVQQSSQCTYIGRSEEYAAIIKAATNSEKGSNVSDNQYAVAQLALGMFKRGDRNYCPDNGSQCSAARDLYDSAVSGQIKTEINKQKSALSMSLTQEFARNSANNYVGKFTVSGGNEVSSVSNCTVNGVTGATTSINGAVVTVTVPQNSLRAETTQISLSCSATREFYASQYFDCGSGYQQVALARDKWRETGNVNSNASITKEQTKGSIKITKKGRNSQKSKKPLQGVKFKIKNKAGHYINASGEVDEDYVFTTNSSGIIQVTNIDIPDPDKSYEFTLEEVSTLSGYAKAIGTMKITLNSANNFTYDEELINETVRVTISKTDATGKKELPGAKLSILDKDGKVLNKCVFDKEKHLITYSDGNDAEACTWASTDVSYIFEGLPKGKYYLVEDLAPEGYSKSTEKILIEIKDTGAVKDKIVMKNALEVPVPDTLSARSALLLVVAMFDIALGIGIVTYVKNHKIEE